MLSTPLDGATSTHARASGRQFVIFGGCNYLGLAQHPRVIGAAGAAAGRYGLSTSASRTTTGNTTLHEGLEADLCAHLGAEAALLLPDGYTANIAALQTLSRTTRVAVVDERAHRSLFDAAATARVETRTYRHRDAEDAARVAGAVGSPVVIMTDGVFAADGAIAPLAELLDALPDAGSRLLVDDCHGFVVLGRDGRGTLDELAITPDDRVVVTTTLAKGLGCAGGAVLGTRPLIETARLHAGAFVCTTPTSPMLIAAAREALRVVTEEPARLGRLRANAARLSEAVAPHEITPDPRTPIAAFTLGDEPAMQATRATLEREGIAVPLVAYPGGPVPVYFRATVTADHTPEQLDRLALALRAIG